MKRLALLLSLLGVLSAEKFMVRVTGGAEFSAGRQFGGTAEEYDSATNQTSGEALFYSLGRGIPLNADFLFMLNDTFAIQAGTGWHFGLPTTTDKLTSVNGGVESTKIQGSYLPISAGATVRAAPGKKFRPFVNAAVLMALAGKVKEKYFLDAPGNNDTSREYLYTLKPGLGFTGSFGIEYTFDKSFTLIFEVKSTLLSMRAAARELTAEMISGTETDIGNLPDSLVKREYVDFDSKYTPGVNKPVQSQNVPVFPFHSLGLSAGIAFKF